MSQVIGFVRKLGLEVAPQKTQAVLFYDRKRGSPLPAEIQVGTTSIRVGLQMKYLGFTIDGLWEFGAHFEQLTPRLGRLTDALAGIMPNLHGPGVAARRGYMHAVLAALLYGVPVWDNECAANRVVRAVSPHLKKWIERGHGALFYRLTQVLTGHGCFGGYLRRIGKEPTAGCHHCDAKDDSASYTVEECPAWASERGSLAGHIEEDLSLPALISAMLRSEREWKAVSSFCEAVMLRKEAETERERITRGGEGGVDVWSVVAVPVFRPPLMAL
ncbi:PREDICTED: uncharacterized protein LOC108758204 [Trachymyrmex cornetzi]|uniref:uncharacterized protein LOC108758204 n=1 Tax=Trachymyrmex cornetzi TaxID=471704 RepID=UPI00084F0784|nr:PREDICTED: uncharacterized protein LOC108758204 [Trachymyrmex cornetzi]